jgi:predicted DNA-binding transcriptional regulator AlpA
MSHAARHSHRPLADAALPNAPEAPVRAPPSHDPRPPCHRPIRMLRLPQVIDATGLGKTKIYELQGQGDFPMRVKITAHSVAWVEEDVQAWLAARIQANSTQNTA